MHIVLHPPTSFINIKNNKVKAIFNKYKNLFIENGMAYIIYTEIGSI